MVRIRKIHNEAKLIELMHKPEKKVILLMAKWSPLAVTIQKLFDFHAKKFLNCKFYYVDIEEFEEPKRFFDYTTIPIIKCIDKDGDLVVQQATTSNKKILKIVSELNDNGFENVNGKIDLRRFSKDPRQLEEFIKNRELNSEVIQEETEEDLESQEESESEEEREVSSSPVPRRENSDRERRRQRRREREKQNEFIDIQELDEEEESEKKSENESVDSQEKRRTMRRTLRESNVNRIGTPMSRSNVSIDMNSIKKSREKRKQRLQKEKLRDKKFERELKLENKRKSLEKEDEEDIIMDSESESENEEEKRQNGMSETIKTTKKHFTIEYTTEEEPRKPKKKKKKRFKRKLKDSEDFFDLGYSHLNRLTEKKKKTSELRKKPKYNPDEDSTKFVRRSNSSRSPSRSTSGRRRRNKDYSNPKSRSETRFTQRSGKSPKNYRNYETPWEKEKEKFSNYQQEYAEDSNEESNPSTSRTRRRRRQQRSKY